MKSFGIIGFPLTHSFSQKYFSEKFIKENISDCEFKIFPIENINNFPNIIKENENLCGLSVTIPYKEKIISFLDEIDNIAQSIGAINSIKIFYKNGKRFLKGYNTDVFGFQQTIKPFLDINHERALILGSGGASKAVQYVLKEIGIDFLIVKRGEISKRNEINWSEINDNIIKSHQLIINTTPLGMFPNIEKYPEIPYENITSKYLLYDLIYNPEKTKFLEFGEKKNAIVLNGLQMLHFQAKMSWKIWNEIN